MRNELGTSDPSLMSYLHVLRRRRWWVVGLVVLCFGAALGYALTTSKKYSASAQLLVQPSTGSVSLSGTQVDISSTDVLTALQLATSAPVQAAVAKTLGSAPGISASEVGQTNVIELTATSTSPAEAAKIANLYAVNFVTYERKATSSSYTTVETQLQSQITSINGQVTSLQNQKPSSASTANQVNALSNEEYVLKGELAQLEVTGAASTGGLQVVSPARVPTSPSSPTLRGRALRLAGWAGIRPRGRLLGRLRRRQGLLNRGCGTGLPRLPGLGAHPGLDELAEHEKSRGRHTL